VRCLLLQERLAECSPRSNFWACRIVGASNGWRCKTAEPGFLVVLTSIMGIAVGPETQKIRTIEQAITVGTRLPYSWFRGHAQTFGIRLHRFMGRLRRRVAGIGSIGWQSGFASAPVPYPRTFRSGMTTSGGYCSCSITVCQQGFSIGREHTGSRRTIRARSNWTDLVTGFLLDTNVLSEFARRQPVDGRVDAWLKALPDESLFVGVLTFAEIRRGYRTAASG
jgi:hypothetical protein